MAIPQGLELTGTNRFNIYRGRRLSPRETEVLKLSGELNRYIDIATKLNISIKTVEKHRQTINYKLGFHCIGDLIHYCFANNLIKNKYDSPFILS